MKKALNSLLVILFLAPCFGLFAQVPDAINFQAIARGQNGAPITNTAIMIRLSVIDSAQGGATVYQEIRSLTTNAYGSFSFQIGVNPSSSTGSFQAIRWAAGYKFLKIDYDPSNTSTWSLSLGIVRFVTVPYAFTAGSVVYIDTANVQNGDVPVFNSASGKFEPQTYGGIYNAGDGIDISGNVITNTGDTSNINEIQSLSLAGNDLSISNGNTVTLPVTSYSAGNGIDINGTTITNTGDTSNTNEIQSLSVNGSNLTISGGNTVSLPVTSYTAGAGININANIISNTGDTSKTNEIQSLSINGTSLSISSGNTVILPNTVYSAGTGIQISAGSISNTGDLSATNEIQSLSVNGTNLSISSGNTVALPITNYTAGSGISINSGAITNTGDLSATNELQTLSQVLTQGNDAGNKKIANLATPTLAKDAVNKVYVDSLKSRITALELALNSTGLVCLDGRDQQIYKTVLIGTQYWMAQNLNYKSATSMYYNNDSVTNAATYGRLYLWSEALTACPAGWHLPDTAEYGKLISFLGGSSAAGGKLKEAGTTHWVSPNTGATNSSGFTAVPGGDWNAVGGFADKGYYGCYWTSTSFNTNNAYYRFMRNDFAPIYLNTIMKTYGQSIRCVKN